MLYVFCLSLFILVLFVLISAIFSYRKKFKISKPVTILLSVGIVTLLSYTLSIIFSNHFLSDLFATTYFASIDWLLFSFFDFIIQYSEKKRLIVNNTFKIKLNTLLITCAFGDTISLYLNMFVHHAFISTLLINEKFGFHYWHYEYLTGFTFHLYLSYVLVAFVLFELVTGYFKSPKIYKKRFLYIFLSFLLIILVNIIYLIQKWKMDYSMLFYGILTLLVCYYSIICYEKDSINYMTNLYSENIKSAVFAFDYSKKCIFKNSNAYKLLNGKEQVDSIAKEYLNTPWLKKKIEENIDYVSGDETFFVNDDIHYFSVEYQVFRNRKNKEIGSYLKFTDRTEEILQRNTEKMNATHDSLTGLLNRTEFFRKAEEIITTDPQTPRYMIATNICDFKFVNDVFGSELGDKILIEQANMLLYANYEDCIHGRISSDRYAMLIQKKFFNEKFALKNSKRIEHLTKGLNYKLRIVLGVYEIVDNSETVETMFDKASMAIDTIKNNYEKQICYYDSKIMEQRFLEKMVIVSFPRLLETKSLPILLQPVYDINNEIYNYEALVKWNDAENWIFKPSEFIPVLEKSVYINNLDKYVWKEICSLIKEQNQQNKHICVSLNISSLDFYYTNLFEEFSSLVERYKISPKSICLEIQEKVFISDKEKNIKIINQLKDYGFEIIFDDFGNGFSSLFLYNEIKPSAIKVNMQSLDISKNIEKTKKILKNISLLSETIDVKTIGKCIETKEELELLKECNFDYFQGYLLGKPEEETKICQSII